MNKKYLIYLKKLKNKEAFYSDIIDPSRYDSYAADADSATTKGIETYIP